MRGVRHSDASLVGIGVVLVDTLAVLMLVSRSSTFSW